MVGSTFVTDTVTSVDAWINEGVQKLHERVVSALESEYIESEATLTTVAGQSDYALPADFFKLYGVDLNIAGVARTLRPYNRSERNRLQGSWVPWMDVPRYRIVNSTLRLYPAPPAGTGKIFYAPTAALLAAGGDTVNFPNGWEKYVVVYAAIQMLMKEESSTTELRRELEAIEGELVEARANRDAAFPKSAVDTDAVNDTWRF